MFCLLVSLLSLEFGCVKSINISLSNQTTTIGTLEKYTKSINWYLYYRYILIEVSHCDTTDGNIDYLLIFMSK